MSVLVVISNNSPRVDAPSENKIKEAEKNSIGSERAQWKRNESEKNTRVRTSCNRNLKNASNGNKREMCVGQMCKYKHTIVKQTAVSSGNK